MSGARCTYVLPLRRTRYSAGEAEALTSYFRGLRAAGCDVIVIDGSPATVFREHALAWRHACRHVGVDPRYRYLNGKVNGVHTGVDLARTEAIILADDDIRYTPAGIARMTALLARHEMVRPQNYLAPRPWWARLEAARMLVNRGVLRTGDYPGTLGFRRSAMLRVGHYDGDVLFDNEEIVRHFAAQGADVRYDTNFFVLKRPPSFAKWREQRPRQAYEDFGMRTKTALFALLLPAIALAGVLGGGRAAGALAAAAGLAAVALALRGRRGAARGVVPAGIALYAPLWVLERSVSTYWALWWWARHGGYPFGARLLSRGTGRAWAAGGRAARRRAA